MSSSASTFDDFHWEFLANVRHIRILPGRVLQPKAGRSTRPSISLSSLGSCAGIVIVEACSAPLFAGV